MGKLEDFIDKLEKSTPHMCGKVLCEMIKMGLESEEEIEKQMFLDIEYPEDNGEAIDVLIDEGIVEDFDELSRAFERLLIMRNAFYVRLGNWKPDWEESNDYWGIVERNKKPCIILIHIPGLFVFPSYESAEKFLETCKEDLELFFSYYN